MTIRKAVDALMARLGYVRAPAKMAPTSIPLTIEVDSSQVREVLNLLEQVAAAASEAEAAVHRLNVAAGTEFAAANFSTTT